VERKVPSKGGVPVCGGEHRVTSLGEAGGNPSVRLNTVVEATGKALAKPLVRSGEGVKNHPRLALGVKVGLDQGVVLKPHIIREDSDHSLTGEGKYVGAVTSPDDARDVLPGGAAGTDEPRRPRREEIHAINGIAPPGNHDLYPDGCRLTSRISRGYQHLCNVDGVSDFRDAIAGEERFQESGDLSGGECLLGEDRYDPARRLRRKVGREEYQEDYRGTDGTMAQDGVNSSLHNVSECRER
jgi:hypothetical protein